MQYYLYHTVKDGLEVKETFDSIAEMLKRSAYIQEHAGELIDTIYCADSEGDEIGYMTGLYLNRRAPCPVTEAIADDAAERDSGVHCTGHVDYAPESKRGLYMGFANGAQFSTDPNSADWKSAIKSVVLTPEQCRAADSSETLLVNANWLGELLNERESPDANVEAVREAMLQRSEFGLRKYGVTTANSPLGMAGWLQHLQEELMDATVYVQCLKNEVEAENRRLRILIADAYEQGYEQRDKDGTGWSEPNIERKDEYVNRVLAEQVKGK